MLLRRLDALLVHSPGAVSDRQDWCWRHVLHRHRPIDRDTVHQAALRQVIVFDRQVLRTAIVPHEEVADAPLVPLEELRARHEVGQLLDEREYLRCRACTSD